MAIFKHFKVPFKNFSYPFGERQYWHFTTAILMYLWKKIGENKNVNEKKIRKWNFLLCTALRHNLLYLNLQYLPYTCCLALSHTKFLSYLRPNRNCNSFSFFLYFSRLAVVVTQTDHYTRSRNASKKAKAFLLLSLTIRQFAVAIFYVVK